MNGNYNDIIDIISTFIENETLQNNIAISGSIIPYLILEKESKIIYNDLNIFVKEKYIDDVRKIIKDLSKEYEFDVVDDSKKLCTNDYGFKIKYEDIVVKFKPYSIINNNLKIKSYKINNENKTIILNEKTISEITKNAIIRRIKFGNKFLRIISPEFICADMLIKEIKDENSYKLFDMLCDESILKILTRKMCKATIKQETRQIKKIGLF